MTIEEMGTEEIDTEEMNLVGRESPPMANGELVFDLPWESRVFGMARFLCEKGFYEWDEFRACLISEIEKWDASHTPEDDYHYYTCFYGALEKLLTEKGICHLSDLSDKSEALLARPHGHDH